MIEAGTMDGIREGEDEGSIGLFQPDPFLQPPILKALFEQLPLEDLAKCRLVSKLWYEESLSTWRSNATLKIVEGGIVCTRDDGSSSTTSLGEFFDLWDAGNWDTCPVKRFNLSWWNFKVWDVEQQRFMELVGAHVTSLTLEWCSFVGRDNFRRIIYQAFPKLQFLKIDVCKVDKDDYWEEPAGEILVYKKPAFGVHGLKSLDISRCRPHSIMDMLSHFHKLETLRLRTDSNYYRNLLETIKLIRAQDRTKLPLKNFDVPFLFELGQTTASSMELLKLHDQLNLPLQRLEFHGVDRYGVCKTFPFGFHLENLKKLILPSRLLHNLSFLMYTPNLRVLEIWRSGPSFLSMPESAILFSNSSQLDIGNWTFTSLTDLRLELPLSDCNLRKLMKWMPNVEKLWGLELSDVQFSMVCKNWKNLTHLEDRGGELSDEGVMGIVNVHEACGEETPSCPNITQLKHLTSFATRSSNLTSVSVHEGFLKMANLKELKLGRSTKIGKDAKAALERRKIKLDLYSY